MRGSASGPNVDPARVQRRLETRYLDRSTASLDDGLACAGTQNDAAAHCPVGLVGNCADVLPELVTCGFVPTSLRIKRRRTIR